MNSTFRKTHRNKHTELTCMNAEIKQTMIFVQTMHTRVDF